jgi:hypothetical protein
MSLEKPLYRTNLQYLKEFFGEDTHVLYTKELCEYFDCDWRTLKNKKNENGKLPITRDGGKWSIPITVFASWLSPKKTKYD